MSKKKKGKRSRGSPPNWNNYKYKDPGHKVYNNHTLSSGRPKKKYKSMVEAMQAASEMSLPGKQFQAYKCSSCGQYHIGFGFPVNKYNARFYR